MHPALRKGPLFLQNTPIFHFFTIKHPAPISLPAYGPVYVVWCIEMRSHYTLFSRRTFILVSTISKPLLSSNAFWAKSSSQFYSLLFKSARRTNRQNQQTEKLRRFWRPRWSVNSEPNQTQHGGRGLRALLAPLNVLRSDAQFRC